MVLTARAFSLTLIALVAATLLISLGLHAMDLTYTNNDLIRHYQLSKLGPGCQYSTIIVGDSSAGNAIDSKLFGRLCRCSAANLALTGSFGLAGSLNTIRQATGACPIRNVVIIQTLDIWRRPFELQAYYESTPFLEPIPVNHPFFADKTMSDYLQYVANPREIGWLLKYLFRSRPLAEQIDVAHDYLAQRDATIANGGVRLAADETLSTVIEEDNVTLFDLLDIYCGQARLNCTYAHGPMYSELFDRSRQVVEQVETLLAKKSRHITFVPGVVTMERDQVGDTPDHANIGYKFDITRIYYERLQQWIR